MIDNSLSWKYHISYICSRISRNTGIVSKLRHYLCTYQLKQIYFSLVYPFTYAAIAWGSAYKRTYKNANQAKYSPIRLMFFATTSGPFTESALPYLNLLEVLTVNNVYRFYTLKFTHLWLLPNVFDKLFQYASSRHTYNTRDASMQPTWENKCFRIKQLISGEMFLIT